MEVYSLIFRMWKGGAELQYVITNYRATKPFEEVKIREMLNDWRDLITSFGSSIIYLMVKRRCLCEQRVCGIGLEPLVR